MGNLKEAADRYREHRRHTRVLLEEKALQAWRLRVDVVEIDDDILRRIERDWCAVPSRSVDWDWHLHIMEPLRRSGPRRLDLAFLVRGELCGLAVARVSRRKRWISLTHVEGSPCDDHPLKGRVLPLAELGLYIFRSQICDKDRHLSTGIRALNPLDDVVPYYCWDGHREHCYTKRLNQIVIQWPYGNDDENRYAKDAGCATPPDLLAQPG